MANARQCRLFPLWRVYVRTLPRTNGLSNSVHCIHVVKAASAAHIASKHVVNEIPAVPHILLTGSKHTTLQACTACVQPAIIETESHRFSNPPPPKQTTNCVMMTQLVHTNESELKLRRQRWRRCPSIDWMQAWMQQSTAQILYRSCASMRDTLRVGQSPAVPS